MKVVLMNGINAFIKEAPESLQVPSTRCSCSENWASRKQNFPGTKSTDALILDFPDSEL